jgi:hypothetical protein
MQIPSTQINEEILCPIPLLCKLSQQSGMVMVTTTAPLHMKKKNHVAICPQNENVTFSKISFLCNSY